MKSFEFHPEAKSRLAEIWHFTFQHWGEIQADQYTLQIEAEIKKLCSGEKIGRIYKNIKQHNIKYILCQRHYVFYTENEKNIFVLTVLHDNMDLPA